MIHSIWYYINAALKVTIWYSLCHHMMLSDWFWHNHWSAGKILSNSDVRPACESYQLATFEKWHCLHKQLHDLIPRGAWLFSSGHLRHWVKLVLKFRCSSSVFAVFSRTSVTTSSLISYTVLQVLKHSHTFLHVL